MAFMERAIASADYVLIICTPKYKARADGRVGGVGYEGNIISSELYGNNNERKFIPVIRRGDYKSSLPIYCAGKNSADLSGDPYSIEEYSKLLSTLKSEYSNEDIFAKNKSDAKSKLNNIDTYLKYESNEEGGISIQGYTKELKGNIFLPQYIDGKVVTDLGSHAFQDCMEIESIRLPSSITHVGPGAFHNCKRLKSIVLPDNLTRIEDGVFYGCANLEDIVIPERVTYIGMSAFRECVRLKSIIIPENVYSIDRWAFVDCHSLQNLTIRQGVCKIGLGAFHKCISLDYIYFPESVTFIDGWAFDRCQNLKCVNVSRRCIVGESVFPRSTQIRSY